MNDGLKSVMVVIAVGEGKHGDGLWEKRVSCVAIAAIANNGKPRCCCCLLTRRRHMRENQKPVSIEARMSDRNRIGDYELLEKRNEGYRNNGGNEA